MLNAKDRKIIYICADSTTAAKMDLVKLITKTILEMGNTPIAPSAFFAEYLESNCAADTATALEVGISLLCRCDEVWVFGNDITEQMATEIRTAQNLDIPLKATALYGDLEIQFLRHPVILFEQK